MADAFRKFGLALALLIASVLSACASTRGYREALATWEGKPARTLVANWGEPSLIRTLSDGGHVLTYLGRNPDGILIKKYRSPSAERLYDCKTYFVLSPDGIIRGWRFEGYDCQEPSQD